MNKIKMSLAVLTILSVSAFADCNKESCKVSENMDWNKSYTVTSKDTAGKEYFLNIQNIKRDVHVGISSANVFDKRAADWSVGAGISAVVNDNIYLGTNIDADVVTVHSDTITSLMGEIKAGYVFTPKIVGYGLVGVKASDYKGSKNGVGLGIGAGVEYNLCPKMAIAAEYKVYDMTAESNVQDFKNDSVGVKFKYFF
jgi:hypothetical protein